jgi:hypothetical protein
MSIEENGSRVESSREDHTGTSTFDSAARGLADGSVSRGKALRMLAASLFGGALVAAPAAVAVAAPKPGGTGCPKPGEIRVNGKCQCNTAEGLITCGPSDRCVDPNACGGGQHVDPDTCKCVCDNPGETLCPGTGNCISNACPEGAFLETSGESCSCQCRNPGKEIDTIQGKCVCTPVTCAGGELEVQDPDTCACVCAPATVRCGGECVAECLEGFVLKNCECVEEVTCAGVCTEGCCDSTNICRGGDSNTACGTTGTCTDCTQTANTKVCVNGECRQCAANADCGANQQCVNNVCENVVTPPPTCPAGRCAGGPNPVNCGTVAGCVCQGSGANSTCGRPA